MDPRAGKVSKPTSKKATFLGLGLGVGVGVGVGVDVDCLA